MSKIGHDYLFFIMMQHGSLRIEYSIKLSSVFGYKNKYLFTRSHFLKQEMFLMTMLSISNYFNRTFYYVLLASVQLRNRFLSVSELPILSMSSLRNITSLLGPNGLPYQLSPMQLGYLLRLKLSLSIFTDKWVSRNDLSRLTDVIQAEVQSWGLGV